MAEQLIAHKVRSNCIIRLTLSLHRISAVLHDISLHDSHSVQNNQSMTNCNFSTPVFSPRSIFTKRQSLMEVFTMLLSLALIKVSLAYDLAGAKAKAKVKAKARACCSML